MSHPHSFQIYLSSSFGTLVNTTKSTIGINLNEPITVPDGYNLEVTFVDAQIPVVWNNMQKFLLVKTNLKSRNQYITHRYFAKIPIDVDVCLCV